MVLAPTTTSRPTQVRWLIFVLACFTSWLLYLHRYSWGVIKPALKRDYPDLTDVQSGWLDSTLMATYALGQIPSGMAGDILGPRAVLSFTILLWSAMIACLGLSHSNLAIVASLAVFGLAQSGTYPNLTKVTRSWFPLSVRTSVQGAVASLSGRAGGACAALVMSTLLMGALKLGWRESFLVLAGVGGAFGLAFWFLFRNNPRDHPWANHAEQEEVDAGDPPIVPGTRPVFLHDARNLLNLGMLLLYALASTYADILYVFWIPSFLKEAKALSDYEVGFYGSLPLWGGALGGLCGGMLNDLLIRVTGRRRLSRSAVGFSAKLLAAVLMMLSLLAVDGRWAMLVLMASKFCNDASQPTVWGTVTDISGRAAGTIFAIVNATGAVAAFAAGPIMGSIKQHLGWDALFINVAGVYVVGATCWLFIDCTRRLVVEPARQHG